MKTLYTIIAATFACLLPSVASADQQVAVDGLKFAKDANGNLLINMNLGIEGQDFGKNELLIIEPTLSGNSNSVALPQVWVSGSRKDQQYRRKVKFGAEMPEIYSAIKTRSTVNESIAYSTTLPFEEWMDGASLKLTKSLVGCADCREALGTDQAGNVVIPVHIPYVVKPQVNRLEYVTEKIDRKMEESPYLDFKIGSANIVSTFGDNSDEINKIANIIGKIENEAEIQLDQVHIRGYASPDGSYAVNERLAYQRAQSVKDYFLSKYKTPASRMKVESFSEDWDGLRTMVAASDFEQKEQILSIIDSNEKPDAKEQSLKTLGAVYQTMFKEVFPKLRRVYCQVDFTVRDYTPEAAAALRKRDPETLSQRELFILAQSYEANSPERENIYDLILKLYPDDVVAIVNTSATMLESGKDELAKRCLDRAGNDPKVYNNLGVYYLKAGELDRAEELLRKAQSAGVAEAKHNLNELEIKRKDIKDNE